MTEQKIYINLEDMDRQRVENIANACLKAISPFYKEKSEGNWDYVFKVSTEAALGMMILAIASFRDLDIDDPEIMKAMEGICGFALASGGTKFVRVT